MIVTLDGARLHEVRDHDPILPLIVCY